MCVGDECKHNEIDRRDFLSGAATAITTLALSAAAKGQIGNPQARQPETRVLDDPRVEHGMVMFKHNGVDTINGYLARPKAKGVFPGVLIIAGNKITEEYIPNTCAALAVAGFVALATNVFHPLPDDAPNTQANFDKYMANHTESDRLLDVQAGASYLREQSFVSKTTTGVLGFCKGGHDAMLFGAQSRDIDAVVAFHPAPMKPEDIQRLKHVPVQIHHGTADEAVAVTNSKDTYKWLKAQGTPVELFLYEGANHGFLAYTRPFYKPDAAKLAWERSVKFLHKNLK